MLFTCNPPTILTHQSVSAQCLSEGASCLASAYHCAKRMYRLFASGSNAQWLRAIQVRSVSLDSPQMDVGGTITPLEGGAQHPLEMTRPLPHQGRKQSRTLVSDPRERSPTLILLNLDFTYAPCLHVSASTTYKSPTVAAWPQ